MSDSNNTAIDDYAESTDDLQVDEYDITAAPNDFNVLTIYSFLESGSVRIPGFQRNYVWDIGRASKLIESLILGLPVPQIFLYEIERNKFLVIDGQQRLMSIYYFIKQRFPRKDKRSELRGIFDQHGKIPDNVIHDDNYFENFRLKLTVSSTEHPNKFKGIAYQTLNDYKTQFDLRTIRNVVIKQNSPQDDDSSMYEVFNRLNTGGINLKPQEIRMSMYHSKFYEMLYRANSNAIWRRLLGNQSPDIHMKDIEVLLRSFSFLIEDYAPSMVKFVNKFSKNAKDYSEQKNKFLSDFLHSFFMACYELPENAFIKNGRFNVALFEATFVAVCKGPYSEKKFVEVKIKPYLLSLLDKDTEFIEAMREGTTSTRNVKIRLERACNILGTV
jgi:uncharacterized protein with ParB-like and HNH nuclease domain